jgi:aarF domain-containing kinase
MQLGQWAASRTDIFPAEMCAAMSSLHADAPPHALEATRRIVERAFGGRRLEDVFDEFDERPLGVGAIAQVYRARLRPGLAAPEEEDAGDGRTIVGALRGHVDRALKTSPPPGPARAPSAHVAVKVLHPGVERTVERDLRIMYAFAVALDALPTMRWLSLPDEARVFADMMRLQLDLRVEAANLSTFRRNFAARTTACFPYPYAGLAAREVLVEEFAHGVPLAAFLALGAGPYERDVADEGLSAFLHMLLIDNFAHADLHPGNVMVRFYRPDPPAFPPLTKLLPWRRPEPDGDDAGEAEAQDRTAAHATEEAVARLAPHRGDGAAWLRTLAELDAEGFRPQLVFLDAGLVTRLDARNRRNFLDLFRAVAEFDGFRAGRLMAERCATPEQVLDPDVFALRIQHLVLGVKSQTFALGRVRVGDVLADVLSVARRHHVRLEGDFVNVVLSILVLEGVGRQLDPDLDLLAGCVCCSSPDDC